VPFHCNPHTAPPNMRFKVLQNRSGPNSSTTAATYISRPCSCLQSTHLSFPGSKRGCRATPSQYRPSTNRKSSHGPSIGRPTTGDVNLPSAFPPSKLSSATNSFPDCWITISPTSDMTRWANRHRVWLALGGLGLAAWWWRGRQVANVVRDRIARETTSASVV